MLRNLASQLFLIHHLNPAIHQVFMKARKPVKLNDDCMSSSSGMQIVFVNLESFVNFFSKVLRVYERFD